MCQLRQLALPIGASSQPDNGQQRRNAVVGTVLLSLCASFPLRADETSNSGDDTTPAAPYVESHDHHVHDDIIQVFPTPTVYDLVQQHVLSESDLPGDYKPVLSRLDFYLRTGALMPLGEGILEDHLNPAWTIQGGVMQPIAYSDGHCWTFSAEFGGGLTDFANGGSFFRGGTFFTPEEGIEIPIDEFGKWKLDDVRRTSFHLALGGRYEPPGWNNGSRGVQIGLRSGVRVGRIHGEWFYEPGQPLQQIVNDRIALGLDPDLFELRNEIDDLQVSNTGEITLAEDGNRSETFAGLFTSVSVGVTYYDVCLGSWRLGDVTIGAEVEFSYDWFDLGHNQDDALRSLSTLFTILFTR